MSKRSAFNETAFKETKLFIRRRQRKLGSRAVDAGESHTRGVAVGLILGVAIDIGPERVGVSEVVCPLGNGELRCQVR